VAVIGSPYRRALAVLSLAALAALVAVVALAAARNVAWLAVALGGLALGTAGAWWAITEHAPRRLLGCAGLAIGAGLVVVAIVETARGSSALLERLSLAGVLLLVTLLAGSGATAADRRELDRLRGSHTVRPRKPVLLCNPWSGGGKVARFGLPEIAASLGVGVVMLDHGLDLAVLARDAIAGGADCLGMAGGDGSQALVAAICHEHDIPFVCISAGTRNHFAQDLGFDKEDPRKGMAAFTEGVERFIDYGTVGDRLFVNNVSMGVYATIVQQDSYRGAKIQTAREMLPEMLSHQAEPFDLQFTTPDGVEIGDAFVVQVSNNPYVWGVSSDFAQRRAMDSGRLGVFAIDARTGRQAAEVVTRALTGLTRGDPNFHVARRSRCARAAARRSRASTARRSSSTHRSCFGRTHVVCACSCLPT